jgi:ABC-type multidrug transport system fused ATPase/permease subunit
VEFAAEFLLFSMELASAKDVGNHQNISLDSLHLRIDNISAMTSTLFPLVIDNLSFRYRDRQGAAIHNISFTANP